MLQHGAPFIRAEAIQKATNAQVAHDRFDDMQACFARDIAEDIP